MTVRVRRAKQPHKLKAEDPSHCLPWSFIFLVSFIRTTPQTGAWCSSTIVLSENYKTTVTAPPRNRHLRGPRACSRLQIDVYAPFREATSQTVNIKEYSSLHRREIVPLLRTQHHFCQIPAAGNIAFEHVGFIVTSAVFTFIFTRVS
jgi:hypothetical protein